MGVIQMSDRLLKWSVAILLLAVFSFTTPGNHSEAEDVYDFALKVEQGNFADQAGVNRVLALPTFGLLYDTAQSMGYGGRAFPFMVFINRTLAVLCVFLFWKLLCIEGDNGNRRANMDTMKDAPPVHRSSSIRQQLPKTLLLAFSYGFWRYANEAETYILASVFVLSTWCLVLRGRWLWAVLLSSIGVLVHLLNMVPLLLAIPVYYLLSRQVKQALIHGLAAVALIGLGYGISAPWLDWSQLGAHHHGLESGLQLSNLLRAGVAFGQTLLSGNFVFGFEAAREALVGAFPSRMLGEEFFMAEHMDPWIPWAGCVTLALFTFCFLGFGLAALMRPKAVLECSSPARFPRHIGNKKHKNPRAFFYASLVWLLLYFAVVIVTEAGSPELWIMALIPFWLLLSPLLNNFYGWVLVVILFVHNLVAGLLPVMSSDGDYHAAKGRWLIEHAQPEDLILSDYEPVMIFYLNYYGDAKVINSGMTQPNDLQLILGRAEGRVYAFYSFFHPMESMRVRNPKLYEQMVRNGAIIQPEFVPFMDDEFGGLWVWKPDSTAHE